MWGMWNILALNSWIDRLHVTSRFSENSRSAMMDVKTTYLHDKACKFNQKQAVGP